MSQEQASGIYQITCSVNNKRYIGSAVHLLNRKTRHLWELKNNTHVNSHLQRAYNKYGLKSFTFSVLEYVPITELITIEQYWIYRVRPEFNICLIAGSHFGYKHSIQTKRKIGAALKGRKFTEESRLKMSESSKGKIISKETREKLSRALKGKPRGIRKIKI